MNRKTDQAKFSELMQGLSKIFDPGRKISAVVMELYFKALEDLTIEQIAIAVSKVIRERVYSGFPKPAEIRLAIKPPDIDQLSDPLGAWLLVERHIEGGPMPTDPVVNKTVATMGGYERLGLQSYAELVWVQKDFERRYELLNHRRDIFELPAPQQNYLKLTRKSPNDQVTHGTKNLRQIAATALRSMPEE